MFGMFAKCETIVYYGNVWICASLLNGLNLIILMDRVRKP